MKLLPISQSQERIVETVLADFIQKTYQRSIDEEASPLEAMLSEQLMDDAKALVEQLANLPILPDHAPEATTTDLPG